MSTSKIVIYYKSRCIWYNSATYDYCLIWVVTATCRHRACSFSIIDAARVPLGGTYGAAFAAWVRRLFSTPARVPGDGNISSDELRWSRSRWPLLFRLAVGTGGACTPSFLTSARISASSESSSSRSSRVGLAIAASLRAVLCTRLEVCKSSALRPLCI
jgi:hypothetical protein